MIPRVYERLASITTSPARLETRRADRTRARMTRPRDDDDGYETFKKSSPDSQMTVPSH